MNSAEKAEIFRKLVSGQYIPAYGSEDLEFTFQTVINRSAINYCCCSCAFEHEFFDYVLESGKIDQEIVEKILQSIRAGKCPHVDHVPADYIAETTVYGVHIIAAVGTEESISEYLRCISKAPHYRGGIFSPHPYAILAVKNKLAKPGTAVQMFWNCAPLKLTAIYPDSKILCGERSNRENLISFECISFAELIARKKCAALLNGFPGHKSIARTYEAAFRHGLKETQEFVFAKIMSSLHAFHTNLNTLAETLIVCNQPDLLENVLEEYDHENEDIPSDLIKTCCVLQRNECEKKLFKRGLTHPTWRNTPTAQIDWLIRLLEHYPYFRDDIKDAFEQVPDVNQVINATYGESKSKNTRYTDRPHDNFPHEFTPLQCRLYHLHGKGINILVQLLIELGADINMKDPCGRSTLQLLQNALDGQPHKPIYSQFRHLLELILYENPDLGENGCNDTMAVALSQETDIEKMEGSYELFWDNHELWNCAYNTKILPGQYVMDGIEHSLFGHDQNVALNFTTPLLIEAGFRFRPANLEWFISKGVQCQPVKTYLQNCLNVPRTLKLCCRDALRKYYKGRQIHKFVSDANLEKPMQDFILLKSLLHTVPYTIKDSNSKL